MSKQPPGGAKLSLFSRVMPFAFASVTSAVGFTQSQSIPVKVFFLVFMVISVIAAVVMFRFHAGE